jgi:hypothetical protein
MRRQLRSMRATSSEPFCSFSLFSSPGQSANTVSTQVEEFNRLDVFSAITASVLASSLRLL